MSINTRYTSKPKPISAPKPCIPKHLVVADVNSTCEGGLYVNTNMKHSTSSNAGPWARMQDHALSHFTPTAQWHRRPCETKCKPKECMPC